MYFDYREWRCQLRDKEVTINKASGIPNAYAKVKRTEFWFYHFCYHNDPCKALAKSKGRCKGAPPGQSGWSIRRDENGNQYKLYWCQKCSKQIPWEVLDYFAKALELWRLAATP